MIDKTTSQIPIPVLIPLTGWALDGLAADANMAIPSTPNVTSIARKTNVPAKMAGQEMRNAAIRSNKASAMVPPCAAHGGQGESALFSWLRIVY
jgi:hypothetical protein